MTDRESSLTSPGDRLSSPTTPYRPDQTAPTLSNTETESAMAALNNTTFVRKFPEVERRYADPTIDLQKVGLISFIPAKGATPDEKGIFGFAKLRGNYATETEANERAEYIIKNLDSYHQIYHTFVGRPFPITVSSDFSKEINRVDLRKEMTENISHDVKKKREKEAKDIEDIKRREQELLNESKRKEETPNDPELVLDEYITLRVKKAQLSWAYLETKKKLADMVGIIARTRVSLEEMEVKNPENKEKYFQKYMDAREKAGLDTARHQDNFIKFMVEDVTIPEVEDEYRKIMVEEKEEKTSPPPTEEIKIEVVASVVESVPTVESTPVVESVPTIESTPSETINEEKIKNVF